MKIRIQFLCHTILIQWSVATSKCLVATVLDTQIWKMGSLLGAPVLPRGLPCRGRRSSAGDRKPQTALSPKAVGPCGPISCDFREPLESSLPPSLEFHNPAISTPWTPPVMWGTVLDAGQILNLFNAHKNSRHPNHPVSHYRWGNWGTGRLSGPNNLGPASNHPLL